ncbi:MAG: cytochrome c maturation protein CcmE [Deltaproteobacteria bacterium]|nr:cytochrome c maturation protein CcmE [Deltaproteobacteria bacterium]
MKKHRSFSIMILVVGVAIVYLVYSGVKETMVYYITPAELMAQPTHYYDQDLRIGGKVVTGSLVQGDSLRYQFDLVEFQSPENTSTIPVEYQGAVPDAFKEGAHVIVEGTYPSDGIFKASKILTKCPSKYEPDLEQKVPTSNPPS